MSDPQAAFGSIEEKRFREGSSAALEALARTFESERKLPQLFEALLMKSRLSLGLPLVPLGPAADLPEEVLRPHEEAIAAACRKVGGLFLEGGDIVAGWPYFRALGEPGPVAEAVGRIEPGLQRKDLDGIIDIAFYQGVHPRRGLELILGQSGICSAITAMERSLPAARPRQEECAKVLVRALHRELYHSIAQDIARRPPVGGGQDAPPRAAPPEGKLCDLTSARPWLFENAAYHVDPSHLNAVVRLSALIGQGPELELALEMAEYGRRLDAMYQYRGDPPFENLYADHGLFLRGRLAPRGEDGARAAHHFLQKARDAFAQRVEHYPLGVVAEILVKLGRPMEAVDLAQELDPGGQSVPISTLGEICQAAGEFRKLAEVSRKRGDLLYFAAAVVQGGPCEGGTASAGVS